MTRFAGQSVLVTGAGSGIGAEIATQLRAEGAMVYGADLGPSAVPEGVIGLPVDVTQEESVRSAVQRVLADTGRLDVMCNNAGTGSTTSPLDCTAQEWDRVFAVNARGVFFGVKHALPPMLAQGRGSIVNTASVAGLVGLRDRTSYCASKGAVIALTKQVAIQYAGTGVRCNCVSPGTVDSPWVGRLLGAADDPAAARAALVARQPLGRLGLPSEIACAVLYLASDEAGFVTGTDLVIDGGLTAG